MWKYAPWICVGIAIVGLLEWTVVMVLGVALEYWVYVHLAVACVTFLSLFLVVAARAWWQHKSMGDKTGAAIGGATSASNS